MSLITIFSFKINDIITSIIKNTIYDIGNRMLYLLIFLLNKNILNIITNIKFITARTNENILLSS